MTNKHDSTSSRGEEYDGILIRCSFESQRGMFRVIEAKGKALSSGGFGVTISTKPSEETDIDATAKSAEYLFVEEMLFLQQQGLLECMDNATGSALDSAQLFRMLPILNLSLPMYLVYAHLRSQDFRVLRHSPDRLSLLMQQEKLSDTSSRQESTRLRQQVRTSIAEAPPPSIDRAEIAWDAYNPNSKFGKTHPGLPNFYVAVTYYNEPHIRFSQINNLIMNRCHGIPLKLATVSDSGTVVMFGVSNMGVPKIGDKI